MTWSDRLLARLIDALQAYYKHYLTIQRYRLVRVRECGNLLQFVADSSFIYFYAGGSKSDTYVVHAQSLMRYACSSLPTKCSCTDSCLAKRAWSSCISAASFPWQANNTIHRMQRHTCMHMCPPPITAAAKHRPKQLTAFAESTCISSSSFLWTAAARPCAIRINRQHRPRIRNPESASICECAPHTPT